MSKYPEPGGNADAEHGWEDMQAQAMRTAAQSRLRNPTLQAAIMKRDRKNATRAALQ